VVGPLDFLCVDDWVAKASMKDVIDSAECAATGDECGGGWDAIEPPRGFGADEKSVGVVEIEVPGDDDCCAWMVVDSCVEVGSGLVPKVGSISSLRRAIDACLPLYSPPPGVCRP